MTAMHAPALRALQQQLAASALHGAPAGAALQSAIAAGPIALDDALGIHQATVQHALSKALAERVPTLVPLVGEAFFKVLARDYARTHPPRLPQLARYGESLPEFITGYPPVATLPWLADVAAFDLALDLAALQDPDAQAAPVPLSAGVRLQWSASLAVLDLDYAVDALREAVTTADEALLAKVDLSPRPRHFAVWCNQEARAACQPLAVATGVFLRALVAGEPVERALEQVLAVEDGDTAAVFTAIVQELLTLRAVRILAAT